MNFPTGGFLRSAMVENTRFPMTRSIRTTTRTAKMVAIVDIYRASTYGLSQHHEQAFAARRRADPPVKRSRPSIVPIRMAFRAKKTPPSGLEPGEAGKSRWMARRRVDAFNCVGCLPRPIPKSFDGLCAVADLWAPQQPVAPISHAASDDRRFGH